MTDEPASRGLEQHVTQRALIRLFFPEVLPWKFEMTCNLPVKFYADFTVLKTLHSNPNSRTCEAAFEPFRSSVVQSHFAFDGKTELDNGYV
jgi:hypothetical protein